MRNWRLKQKAKQDEIEKQQKQQADKIIKQQTRKRRELTPVDDSFGREVETHLEPQYPHEKEFLGWNIFQECFPNDEPKPKKSFQQILRELDAKHSEEGDN